MLVRQGERTYLQARVKAEPADDVLTRDFYTLRPQIRLTGISTTGSTQPEIPTEVTLDGNDVAGLVECAIRHPSPNMRYAVLAAIWNHPNSFRQIFQFGLQAPPGFSEIRKIVAEELDKCSATAESPAVEPGQAGRRNLAAADALAGAPAQSWEANRMSDWSKVTRPIPVPNEWTKPFWDAAKRGVLELQRCQSCGHFQHPPYATCTQCVSTDLKFEPVRGAGAIYAYTIMYHTGDKRFAVRGALRQHHRRARRCARRADGRQSAGGGIHRGEGRPARRGRLRETERRHHPAAVPPRAPRRRPSERRDRHVGEPVQGGGQRRGLFQGHALGRDSARRPCADGGQGGGRRFRAADVRHRRSGDLSGIAGDRARGGRRHLDRVGQLHDGDAEIAEPHLAHPGRHDQHRRRGAAGGQRVARRGVQIRGGVAGDAQPARHLPEPAERHGGRRDAVHRTLRLRRSGTGHGGRLYALARAEQPEPREDGDAGGDPAPPHAAQSARLFLRHGADARGLPELADGGLSVLPVRLRHPGAGGGRDRADDGRPGARPEAEAGLSRRLRSAAAFRGGGPHRQPLRATWRAAAARRN